MNNNWCKRASRLKSGNKNKDWSPTKQLDPTIFKSNDMDKRTNDFYKAFASEMLMKDMSKDKKYYFELIAFSLPKLCITHFL